MKNICFYALLVLLLVSHLRVTTSQEYDDQKEFNYIEGSDKGPENWGDLHDWDICKTGLRQSPIDLRDEWVDVVGYLGRLKTSYKPSNSILMNRGHDIALKWVDDAGSIKIDGIDYELQQCHWHSPSEHTINGRRYDLEVHLVHQSTDGKMAVVGIVYEFGPFDPFLLQLTGHLWSLAYGHETEIVAGVIDPRDLTMERRDWEYYRYNGSLTTPPCTEGIVWTVIREKKVRTVSKWQVGLLRQAVHDNAVNNSRPIQPLNGRPVYLYDPCEPTISLQSFI